MSALRWLGSRYYWGQGGFPRDEGRAVEYFEQAAAVGDAESMYNLAVMDTQDQGVYNGAIPRDADAPAPDLERAMRLFEKAADLGFSPALNGLGLRYVNGDGVAKNASKAAELFKVRVNGMCGRCKGRGMR